MTKTMPRQLNEETILAALAPIVDPDLGIGITDLGLIYDIRIDKNHVEVDMTLTSMGCPAGEYLYETVQQTVERVEGVEKAVVNLVWSPPWSEDRVNPEVRFVLGLY